MHAKWGANAATPVPKASLTVPSPEHPHVLGSKMLSPTTVDEIADAIIAWTRARTGTKSGVRRGPPDAKFGHWSRQSYNSMASFGSLTNLLQPMPF